MPVAMSGVRHRSSRDSGGADRRQRAAGPATSGSAGGHPRRGPCGTEATPAAAQPVRGRRGDHGPTVTRSRIFSSVAGPTTLRVPSSSIEAKGCSSRAAMIFAAVDRADAGQRVERLGGCVVHIDGSAGRASVGVRRPRSAAASLAPHGHVDLVPVVDRRGEVEPPVCLRRVDPRPEPAGGVDRIEDPRSPPAAGTRPARAPRRRPRRAASGGPDRAAGRPAAAVAAGRATAPSISTPGSGRGASRRPRRQATTRR